MTHIMVPDGVLPWWLSLAGWLIAAGLVGAALWRLRGVPAARMVPLVGVMTAVMVVVMSIELIPIGYEPHFTTLTGMIVGPWYGTIAALLFNLLRAMVGDGAFTNIGLNTTITWLEIALGAALFALFRPLVRRRRGITAVAAGTATCLSLLAATLVFIGVVRISTIDPRSLVETGSFDVENGQFRAVPPPEGLIGVHGAEPAREPAREPAGDAHPTEAGFGAFATAILILGAIGAAIESTVVGAVTAFVARVRPDLLRLGQGADIPP